MIQNDFSQKKKKDQRIFQQNKVSGDMTERKVFGGITDFCFFLRDPFINVCEREEFLRVCLIR